LCLILSEANSLLKSRYDLINLGQLLEGNEEDFSFGDFGFGRLLFSKRRDEEEF
jgi:hypothetical protein